jgi:hypothetical protein
MRAFPIAAVLGACWTGPVSPAAPESPAPESPAPHAAPIAITEAAFGSLAPDAPATLAFVRAAFPGYDVRPINDPGLEYHAYLGGAEQFFVVTNDDLSIFNIHATSGAIAAPHGWRVGQPFHDAARITRCECWGRNPTCWHRGEHVAVNFPTDCDGITGVEIEAFRTLDGLSPQRVIWSPTPFDGSGAGSD